MGRWRLFPLVVVLLLAVLGPVRGDADDFSLEDALGTTKKPPPSRKPPPSDVPKRAPPANPKDTDNPRRGPSARPRDSGGFDDSDLYDGSLPKGEDNSGNNASQGAIAGIVSAVFATVVGTVSSFIAYQKKKLCFKQSADEENVNMESHRGAQSEPPVQRTLLEN